MSTNEVEINAKKKTQFSFPPLSRYSSRTEWEDVCWHKLLKSGSSLELLFTSRERHNLVMRAAVINGMNLGKRYRQIAEELWLSPQTISSVKKAVSGSGYRSYRERSKIERKKISYSSNVVPTKKKYRGRPQRTKYGTIYMPY